MQEIIFKSWHKLYRQLYDVIQIGFSPGGRFTVRVAEKPEEMFSSDQVDLLQYIGRTDKRGNRIFNKHVVLWHDNPYIVVYEGTQFVLKHTELPKNPVSFEGKETELTAIGTVYEIPDLLSKAIAAAIV